MLRDGAAEWLFSLGSRPQRIRVGALWDSYFVSASQTKMCTTRSPTTISTAFTIHDPSAVRFGRVSCHVESKSCNLDLAKLEGVSAVGSIENRCLGLDLRQTCGEHRGGRMQGQPEAFKPSCQLQVKQLVRRHDQSSHLGECLSVWKARCAILGPTLRLRNPYN